MLNHKQIIPNMIDFEKKGVLDSYYPFNCAILEIEFWVRCHSLITSSRMRTYMVSYKIMMVE